MSTNSRARVKTRFVHARVLESTPTTARAECDDMIVERADAAHFDNLFWERCTVISGEKHMLKKTHEVRAVV